MKKLIPLLLLLASCGAEEESPVITGQNLGVTEDGGPITVFVEDTLHGDTVSHVSDTDFDEEEYEVEAYQITYDEETEVVYLGTEEEVEDITRPEYSFYQEIRIVPAEEFEPQISTNRESYILEDGSLLPVVHAERIEIEPISLENVHTYVEEMVLPNNYDGAVLALLEPESREEMEFITQQTVFYEELNKSGLENERWSVSSLNQEIADIVTEEEASYPSYFIYQEGEPPYMVESIEELLDYVEDL